MRLGIFWATFALLLVALNALIVQKEAVLRSDQVMLLQLAPVDPRSLMQGDYMVLRYAIPRDIPSGVLEASPPEGSLVVALDERNIARFVRIHAGEPLQAGEHLLRYRRRGEMRLGAESFFFQEGHASRYEKARYGELRVTSSGDAVLVGLRGEALEVLGTVAEEEKL